ncbi:DUF3352 domain-containing protein [Trichocoleus sp. FACHB-262]|uniref:DUF3352 domain-containing protein n=1 Tax=Trichocoleus sp. FACHB-262 TaxID=2692869 RepID=UPI001A7E8D2A|nr:DUF3352 domain-containing protein [Trichocoleus sp. FACHB-262]
MERTLLHRFALPLLALLATSPSYVIAQPSSPSNVAKSSSLTTTLPANVAGVVFVNTNTEAWTTLTQFQLFSQAGPFLAGLPALFLGLDLTTDVKPWLGERVAIALMPFTGSEKNSDDRLENSSELLNANHALLLAPVKDTQLLNAFLTKLKASRSQPPIERQYKGVTVWEWPAEKPAQCDSASPNQPGCESAPETELGPETTPQAPSEEEIQPTEPTTQTSIGKPQAFSKLKAVGSTPTLPLPPIPGGGLSIPSIPSPQAGLAIAVLPGYLVTATTPGPIEQLIDARRSKSPALAANPQFQRTMQHPQFQRSLLVAYGNIAEIARFPQPQFPIPTTPPPEEPTSPQPQTSLPRKLKAASQPPSPVPMESLTVGLERLAQDYSTVDGYVWLQPEGIHTQISTYYKTPQPTKADVLTPNAEQILTRMPGATYLASTSRNLKQQWQSFVDITQAEPTLQPALQVVRDGIRTLSGLDLERDWLPWMDGEYAAFLFPDNQGPFSRLYPNLDLGLGLVMQTSDRPAAEAALTKFDQFIKSQSGGALNIATRSIQGQPVTSWEFAEAGDRQSFFAHSWVDQDTLVITTGLGPMKALNPKPYLPLNQNRTFKTATDSFSRPNQGYFYTNMGASLSFIYGLFQPYSNAPETREVKRWLGTVYSISASNSATPEKQQFDSLLVLAPTRKP